MAKPTSEWRHIKKKDCPHLPKKKAKSNKAKCEACGEKTHLRLCLTCGHVACCESHNSHNTEHYKKAGHPLIKPHKCDYDWLWCYKCNAFLE